MRSNVGIWIALAAVGAACAPEAGERPGGPSQSTGGTSGSPSMTPGPSGTGGATGTGGRTGTGGATATGGTTGTGGATATGGTAGTGGRTGTGGTSGVDAGRPVDAAITPPPPRTGDGGIPNTSPDDGGAMAKQQADIDKVFDINVLHKIEIIVQGQANIDTLGEKEDQRVPVTVIFDGVRVDMVGARQSGGTFNPSKKLLDKPSFNLKFNEYIPGQDIHGVKRFTLKNGLQDMSLMNEHLAYETFRRAGLSAPTSAWALVTVKAMGTTTNGEATGIYTMRESVNADFFVRTIGKGYEQGNLYETDWTYGDFVSSDGNVRKLELKDEKEEMRTRTDLLALSAAIRNSTAANFMATVGPIFDIDRYITYHAVETVISAYDNFSFNNNNSFLYNNPKDGRFIIVPWGADQAFWCPQPGQDANYISGPTQSAQAQTSRKMRAVAALNTKYQAEIARIGSPPVWDVAWFKARIAHASALFATAPKVSHVVKDLANHERYKPELIRFIENGGASKSTASLPRISGSN